MSEVPQCLNELKVAQYLNLNLDDKENTFYEKIFRLLPGHVLVSKVDCSITLQSYCSLDPKQEIRFKSQEDYTAAFLEKFTEAVQCRLRSAFPVGSTLSGGLDSSSIACLANQLLRKTNSQKIHTFSAIFPNLPQEDLKWIDERHYIKEVVDSGDFADHYVEADKLDPIIDLLWQNEEPILGPNLYIHSGLYKCANEHGVRIFLDGLDGDTTISHGWRYLTELTYKGRWLKLAEEVSAASKVFRRSRKFILRKFCLDPILEASSNYTEHKWHQLKHIAPFSQLISPDFATEIEFGKHIQSSSENKQFFNLSDRYQQWQSLTSGIYPSILEMADKSTSRFDIEARYPFFDRRLVEFCLALPPEQKFRQGWSRAILRSAMTNILPKSVQWRTSKGNLSYSLNNSLLEIEYEALKQLPEESDLKPYVDTSFLHNTVERFINQPKIMNQDS